MTKRVLILNDDGTAEVNGVKVRVVPVEPQREMLHSADNMMDGDLAYSDLQAIYSCMLYAAAIDLSGLPRAEGDWSALFDGMGVKE